MIEYKILEHTLEEIRSIKTKKYLINGNSKIIEDLEDIWENSKIPQWILCSDAK